MKNKEILETVERLSPWFYSMEIAPGVFTRSKLDPDIEAVHETRVSMVAAAVRSHFGGRTDAIRALDLGCHEGFFSFLLADLGARSVLGVDCRPGNLAKAEFARRISNRNNVRFVTGNAETFKPKDGRGFDLVLFLGLLYHMENPVGGLRRAAELTDDLLVIETQVIDPVPGETEWGSARWRKSYNGVFAVIDEQAAFEAGNPEAGTGAVSLCPSREAVLFLLRAFGFKSIRTVDPPPGAYEQHARGKRIVIAASKKA